MNNKYVKNIMLSLFLIFVLFFGLNSAFAENKTYKYKKHDNKTQEYTYDDSKQALYCGYKSGFYYDFLFLKGDFDDCITVSKPGIENPDIANTVKFKTNLSVNKASGEDNLRGYVITTKEDSVYKDNDSWWKTIQLCYSNSAFHGSLVLFTDSLSVTTDEWKAFISKGECITLKIVNADKKNLVSSCPTLSEKFNSIYSYKKNYQSTKKAEYITKYKEKLEEIKTLCSEVTQFARYDDACVSKCLTMDEEIYKLNKEFDISDNSQCGFSSRLISWIMNIIRWIKYIIPVAVIVLGMIDFIKATGSDKDDDMKKAQGRFVKRLIAAALIFLVPLLVEFILPKIGFDYNSCGIF